MVYIQASPIFMMVLIAIVTDKCLAKYEDLWEDNENLFDKKQLGIESLKRLLFKKRTTACPPGYSGDGNICRCRYNARAVNDPNSQLSYVQPVTANYDGCGPTCPPDYTLYPLRSGGVDYYRSLIRKQAGDYYRAAPLTPDNAPFTFLYDAEPGLLADRICAKPDIIGRLPK